MTDILLLFILLGEGAIIYLLFKLLPQEKKEEVYREAEIQRDVRIMEWQPPKSEDERAFEEGLLSAKK